MLAKASPFQLCTSETFCCDKVFNFLPWDLQRGGTGGQRGLEASTGFPVDSKDPSALTDTVPQPAVCMVFWARALCFSIWGIVP